MIKPELFVDKNGIIIEKHTDLIVSAEVAYYAAAERKRLAGDKKLPLLVQFSAMFTPTADLRDTDLDIITANITAMAFYIANRELDGRMQELTINRYHDIRPLPVPNQVFYEYDEAIAWLKQFV